MSGCCPDRRSDYVAARRRRAPRMVMPIASGSDADPLVSNLEERILSASILIAIAISGQPSEYERLFGF